MKIVVIGFDDRPSTATIVSDWCRTNLKGESQPSTIDPTASSLMRCINEVCSTKPDLIIVCGRTGVARDQFAPQTIAAMSDYEIPGIGEKMRRESEQYSHNAALSRGGVWLFQQTLIAAVPGKETAAIECLSVIKDLLVHAQMAVQGTCKSRGRKL